GAAQADVQRVAPVSPHRGRGGEDARLRRSRRRARVRRARGGGAGAGRDLRADRGGAAAHRDRRAAHRRRGRDRRAVPPVPPAPRPPAADLEPGQPPADRAAAALSRRGSGEGGGRHARPAAALDQLHRGGVRGDGLNSPPMEDSLYFSEQHLQVRDMVRDFAQQVVKPSARRYDLESRFPWDNLKQMAGLGLFGLPWPEELGGGGTDFPATVRGGDVLRAAARTDPCGRKNQVITAFIVTKDTSDLAEAARVGIGHDPALPKCPGVHAAKKEDKLGWRASDTRELVFQDAIVPKENVLGPVNNGFRQFLQTLDGGRIGLGA